MKATLIYNPNAGSQNKGRVEDLLAALKSAGYSPWYAPTDKEEELDEVLDQAEGLVVAAGGDGTIRSVASRLVDKDVLITPLPMGTANNICAQLLLKGDPVEILAGLEDTRVQPFDMGRIQTPWGLDYFLESVGWGLFANILDTYKPSQGKSIARGFSSVVETLREYQPLRVHATLDGEEITGAFLLVEAFNTPTLGPRVKLAPQAMPHDGLFHVVRVREEARQDWLTFFTSILTGEVGELPNIDVLKGKKLLFKHSDGFPFHYDAIVLPTMQTDMLKPDLKEPDRLDNDEHFTITIEILPSAIKFLLPNPKEQEAAKTTEHKHASEESPSPGIEQLASIHAKRIS